MDRLARRGRIARRTWLKQVAGAAICAPLTRLGSLSSLLATPSIPIASSHESQRKSPFPESDDAILEEVEHASFRYFWEQANPKTGLVKDRCNTHDPNKGDLGSIAATGFGLTALCIGDKRRYVAHSEVRGRVLQSLRFLWKQLPHHRGFFYHWANINTGERQWDSEVSSVDTAILLCGVLTCREHFPDSEISRLAYDIFSRVDWTWLSEDTPLLPHGWTPETGFLPYRWDYYSEMMMMYLLGIGSLSHPLSADAWNAWKRPTFEYDGIRYLGSFAPLFINQYSQAWFDFRNKHDQYADYFQNSIKATEVHRRFCLDLSKEFPDYSEDLWGITASDSSHGYVVWGGPPATGPIDGTVVPCASGGSLPFLPDAAMRVVRTIKARYGARAWTQYGFVDAFNPLTNWYDTDVIGIDTGIAMLMAENARTGYVWDTFMKNPEAPRGMARAGFKPYRPTELPLTGSETSSFATSPSAERQK
jgi:hypothetical protein